MKLEIIECSTGEKIETYSVQDFSMLDFQEWKEQSGREVTINLDCLSNIVATLNSVDPETLEPVSDSREVDFYLPTHMTNSVLDQIAKSQVTPEESPDQFADRLKRVTDLISTPELKSSTILSAIVIEILQNHHPYSKYKVKISDG